MASASQSKRIGNVIIGKYVQILSSICSDALACQIQALSLPALVRSRRGANTRFYKRNSLLVAHSSGEELVFYAPERACRYIFRDGVKRAQKIMISKYIPERFHGLADFGTVVDIGANVGEFSMALLPRAKRVFAFEPDPIARRCLEANVGHHNNALVLSVALGSKASHATFYISSKSADSSLIRPATHQRSITVPISRLDDVATCHYIGEIGLLKVEAEGAEPEVLQGAEAVLQTARFVTVDVSPEREGATTEREVESVLTRSGFSIERVSPFVIFGSREG